MERFVIGHNADPANWRVRLEQLNPRCLEIFVPPRYTEGQGLMDLSHVFMTKFYYDLPAAEKPSFPYLEYEGLGRPNCFSRLDFERYLNILRPLYYHVSDTKAPGTRREFEGLPIGKGDTPWADILPAMARHASRNREKLYMIIEVKGGHTADGLDLCSESERELEGFIEDCFASGFLEAISEEGTAS